MSDDYLTDDESWLDMREGDTATVRGDLESVGFGAPGSLIIRFADWSQLFIVCDQPRAAKPLPLSSAVFVRVRRTEDGLDAIAIWMRGCPPIPLKLGGSDGPQV